METLIKMILLQRLLSEDGSNGTEKQTDEALNTGSLQSSEKTKAEQKDYTYMALFGILIVCLAAIIGIMVFAFKEYTYQKEQLDILLNT